MPEEPNSLTANTAGRSRENQYQRAEAEVETSRGTVVEIRPKALFRVRLENGHIVLASLSPSLRHIIARLLVGDQVLLRMAANDPHRGQIIQKAE